MRYIFILILLLICTLCVSTASAQLLEHNITADSIITPPKGANLPYKNCPIEIQFTNNGLDDEDSIRVALAFQMRFSTIYDTVIIPYLVSGQSIVVSFDSVKSISSGKVTVYGISLLETDQNRTDDTISQVCYSWHESDIRALPIDSSINYLDYKEKTAINLSGSFIWNGSFTYVPKQVKVMVRIRNSDTKILKYQAVTTIPSLGFFDDTVKVNFPSSQGDYDTRSLVQGNYQVAIIALLPDDGDRMNDSVFANIKLIENKLPYDVQVDTIYSPTHGSYTDSSLVPVKIRIRNVGQNFLQNVKLVAIVTLKQDSIVYTDTIIAPDCPPQSSLNISFKDLKVSRKGPHSENYKLRVISLLPNDNYKWNDTLKSTFNVGTNSKLIFAGMQYPKNGDTINAGSLIRPTVHLRALWGTDFSQYMIRAEIRYMPANKIIYSCDTLIPQISTDDDHLEYVFPVPKGVQSTWIDSITQIHSGAYRCVCYITSRTTSPTKYDSVTTNFEVVGNSLYNDVGIDSVIFPGKDEVVGKYPIYIKVLFRNYGVRTVGKIDVDITIADTNNYPFFYQARKTIAKIVPQDTALLTFGPFMPEVVGLYKIRINSWPDFFPQWYYDDTLTRYFTVDSTLTSVSNSSHEFSEVLTVNSNFPNPFSARTTLTYEVASGGYVTMRILDVAGVTMETVMSDEFVSEGKHEVTLDGSRLPSGTYFVEMVFKDASGVLAREIQPVTVKR